MLLCAICTFKYVKTLFVEPDTSIGRLNRTKYGKSRVDNTTRAGLCQTPFTLAQGQESRKTDTDMAKWIHPPVDSAMTLLAKLERLYGVTPMKSDALGRRAALPSEIERAIYGRGRDTRDRTNGR